MDELFEEYPKLPKNIRQIGEKENEVKAYVEDYVNTYLRRLYPDPGRLLRVGVLLGNLEVREGIPFLFIDGALEMEGASMEGERVLISDEVWKQTYDEMGRFFPKAEILGWFLCAGPGVYLNPITYWNQHAEYFPGKYKLMYLNHTTEQDEVLFMTSIDGFYKLSGYCIYYERNQCMQDYMVLRKDAKRIEIGVDDSAARTVKTLLQERRGEASRRRSMNWMYGVCSFLLILVLAGGVTMMNNYEKMKSMEVAIANLSDNVVGVRLPASTQTEGAAKSTAESGGIIIEHIQGGVSMTEAESGQEAGAPAGAPQSSPGQDLPGGGQGQESEPAGQGQTGNGPGETGAGQGQTTADQGQTGSSQGQAEAGQGQTVTGQAAGAGSTQGSTSGQDTDTSQGSTSGQGTDTSQGSTSGQGAGTSSGNTSGQEAGQSQGAPVTSTKEEMASIETREPKTPAADEAAAAAGRVHIVKEGETLYSICLKEYESVSKVEEICRLNQLEDPDKIIVGQKLILP